MRFDINLASQPYQDMQRFLVRWSLVLALVAVCTGTLLYYATNTFLQWRASQAKVSYVQRQIEDRNRQKAQAQAFLARPENRDTRDRSQFLNALIARKAFSWTEVFTDLEKIVPARLQVVSITPQVTQEGQLQVRLTAVAPTREPAIEFVRRLEESPHFASAQIISETAQTASPGQPENERFEIAAVYLPSFARPQKTAAAQEQEKPGKKRREASNGGR